MSEFQPTLAEVADYVAASFGLSRRQMIVQRGSRNNAVIRSAFVYLAKRLTPHSFPEIARVAGYEDHTSAVSAQRAATRRLKEDDDFCAKVTDIEQRLLAMLDRVSAVNTDLFALTTEELDQISRSVLNTLSGVITRSVEAELAAEKARRAMPVSFRPKPPTVMYLHFSEVVAVVAAMNELESKKFSDGEYQARCNLERALAALKTEFEQFQNANKRNAS